MCNHFLLYIWSLREPSTLQPSTSDWNSRLRFSYHKVSSQSNRRVKRYDCLNIVFEYCQSNLRRKKKTSPKNQNFVTVFSIFIKRNITGKDNRCDWFIFHNENIGMLYCEYSKYSIVEYINELDDTTHHWGWLAQLVRVWNCKPWGWRFETRSRNNFSFLFLEKKS